MSNNRELLEKAAKAAGFKETGWQDLSGWGEVRYGLSEAIWNGDDYWNPLVSGDDALRLAAKLRIDVIHNDPQDNDAWVMAGALDHVEDVDGESSRPAAMRRAIVRAAAALAP